MGWMSSLRSDHYQDWESRPGGSTTEPIDWSRLGGMGSIRLGLMVRLLVFEPGDFRLGDAEDVGDISL